MLFALSFFFGLAGFGRAVCLEILYDNNNEMISLDRQQINR